MKLQINKRLINQIYLPLTLLLLLANYKGKAQDNEITLPENPASAKSLFLKFDSCIQVNDIVNAVLYADTACQLYESYWTKKTFH